LKHIISSYETKWQRSWIMAIHKFCGNIVCIFSGMKKSSLVYCHFLLFKAACNADSQRILFLWALCIYMIYNIINNDKQLQHWTKKSQHRTSPCSINKKIKKYEDNHILQCYDFFFFTDYHLGSLHIKRKWCPTSYGLVLKTQTSAVQSSEWWRLIVLSIYRWD